MGKYFAWLQFCVPAALLGVFLACATTSSSAQLCPSGTVCVTTWQQDTPSVCAGCADRTGDNLSESMITASSIQNFEINSYAKAEL